MRNNWLYRILGFIKNMFIKPKPQYDPLEGFQKYYEEFYDANGNHK